jgi:hypothetical protein
MSSSSFCSTQWTVLLFSSKNQVWARHGPAALFVQNAVCVSWMFAERLRAHLFYILLLPLSKISTYSFYNTDKYVVVHGNVSAALLPNAEWMGTLRVQKDFRHFDGSAALSSHQIKSRCFVCTINTLVFHPHLESCAGFSPRTQCKIALAYSKEPRHCSMSLFFLPRL